MLTGVFCLSVYRHAHIVHDMAVDKSLGTTSSSDIGGKKSDIHHI